MASFVFFAISVFLVFIFPSPFRHLALPICQGVDDIADLLAREDGLDVVPALADAVVGVDSRLAPDKRPLIIIGTLGFVAAPRERGEERSSRYIERTR